MMVLFWGSLLALLYAFAGYPLLVAWFGRRRASAPQGALPTVSVLLSVYNEEQVIAAKIRNFLDLDYPEECIELLVVSDGSEDGTESLVLDCGSPRVRLIRQEGRGGKTRALNRAAAEAAGEILVFTDANSMFRPDCLLRLAERFADPAVGLVSGRSFYVDDNGRETLGGLYRRYEEWIKEGESGLFSIVGADGAIYALRRELFEPLQPEFINDLLHPVQVVLRGLLAVSEPRAMVREAGEDDGGAELRRQTRIMAQSWLVCLRHLGALFRAGRYGFAWQLISHKVLRWLTVPLLAGLGWSALLTMGAGGLPLLCLVCLGLLLLLAVVGSRRAFGPARAAFMFVLLHWAAMLGLYRLARGETFVTWNPRGN